MKHLRPSASGLSVSGFTLIELMVVVTLAAVLALIAVPSFTSLTQSQQVRNASFELYSALSLARSEAIKRNNNVTIAFAQDAQNEMSWVITAAPGGTAIRKQDFIKGVSINLTGFSGMQIAYGLTGRPALSATNATFQIDVAGVSTPTQYVRCVSIELNGMPRTRMGTCS